MTLTGGSLSSCGTSLKLTDGAAEGGREERTRLALPVEPLRRLRDAALTSKLDASLGEETRLVGDPTLLDDDRFRDVDLFNDEDLLRAGDLVRDFRRKLRDDVFDGRDTFFLV